MLNHYLRSQYVDQEKMMTVGDFLCLESEYSVHLSSYHGWLGEQEGHMACKNCSNYPRRFSVG